MKVGAATSDHLHAGFDGAEVWFKWSSQTVRETAQAFPKAVGKDYLPCVPFSLQDVRDSSSVSEEAHIS